MIFCIYRVLAYVLADLDYDVFMPNSRGSYYSQEHVKFTTSDPQFWNFSFYDIAIHDYPAVIDYVRHETGNDKVFIIGHSQGTTTLMALLSEIPRYNQYVAAASLMAPVSQVISNHRLFFSKVVLFFFFFCRLAI